MNTILTIYVILQIAAIIALYRLKPRDKVKESFEVECKKEML